MPEQSIFNAQPQARLVRCVRGDFRNWIPEVWFSKGSGTGVSPVCCWIIRTGGTLVPLVWCLAYSWCFAARDFGLPRGGSDEHTLQRSVRSEQRRGRPKELLPEGLRRKWLGASLLLSHRSLRICSFVAPRPKPFWAQRNTSCMRDTTLAIPLRTPRQFQSALRTPKRFTARQGCCL